MRTLFCGTENDIKHGIVQIESSYCYIRCGDFKLIESISDYYKFSNINQLDRQSFYNYLVVVRNNTESVRTIEPINIVEKLNSSYSILFFPGGLTADGCLIAGCIFTYSSNMHSREMFRYISRTLRKAFTRVGNYWFGSEAIHLISTGTKFIPVEEYKNKAEGTFNQ
jgi:hypothetical protein